MGSSKPSKLKQNMPVTSLNRSGKSIACVHPSYAGFLLALNSTTSRAFPTKPNKNSSASGPRPSAKRAASPVSRQQPSRFSMSTSASVPTPDWFSQLLGPELTQSQIAQLYAHYELLIRWNQRMNLTTVKPGPEMVIRHYCESLFFAAHIPSTDAQLSVLDLGSGAGFPGIPMAILRPDWRITLVEASQRKAVFLRESSRHLRNVSVLAERMETVSVQSDWVVARAVDPQEILLNVPRLAPNVGLMLGEDDFSSMRGNKRIAWLEPVRLPWGDRKLCVYGSVPRGTDP